MWVCVHLVVYTYVLSHEKVYVCLLCEGMDPPIPSLLSSGQCSQPYPGHLFVPLPLFVLDVFCISANFD